MSQATADKVFNTSELGPPNLTDTPPVNTNNVLNTRELENINLTNMRKITSGKIWVRRPGRGPFSFTCEELLNKDVMDLDDLKKLLLIRFGYDPEKTPTDCILVCHPKEDNLRASTPITELFNDDKSALEVTISEDRNANVKKHETNINCAPPISGYGTQYYTSPVSGYETQIDAGHEVVRGNGELDRRSINSAITRTLILQWLTHFLMFATLFVPYSYLYIGIILTLGMGLILFVYMLRNRREWKSSFTQYGWVRRRSSLVASAWVIGFMGLIANIAKWICLYIIVSMIESEINNKYNNVDINTENTLINVEATLARASFTLTDIGLLIDTLTIIFNYCCCCCCKAK